MGQWGLETSAGDSVHDYLQEICVDTSKFRQFDVKPLLDYTWKDIQVTDRDKLGVVMHLLTHELTVPKDKLQEVLAIAKLELLHKNLKSWSEPEERSKMVVIEVQDIRHAIKNGGKGRARHAVGLFEKIENMIDSEIVEIDKLTNPTPDTPTEIKLPCYGIIVTLSSNKGGAAITSDMQETCSYCEDPACDMDCPDFMEHCSDRDIGIQQTKEAERYEFLAHRAYVDALESIILGHAGAGIDISTPAYIEGIETAVQALTNADYSVEPLG
jgi:hypothetical protein